MKILFVCNDLNYFIAHRINLLNEAKNRGYSITLCTGNYKEAANHPALQDINLQKYIFNRHKFSLFSDIKLIRKIGKLINDTQPDIIQTITMKPNLYLGLSLLYMKLTGKHTNAKCVLLFPGLGKIFEPKLSLLHQLRKKIVQSTFFLSRKLFKQYCIFENPMDRKKAIAAKITTHENSTSVNGAGIDVTIYYKKPSKTKQPIVLFASRMIYGKGAIEFINAANMVQKKFPNVGFEAAGSIDTSNPDCFDISKASEKIMGSVKYIGNLNEESLIKKLQEITVICLPTKLQEGFPRILLEAAFCGKAMIASDQPAVRQIVIPGETGWLVPIEDYATNDEDQALTDSLISTFIEALSNEGKCEEFGKHAHKLAHSMNLDNESVVGAIFKTYEN